MTSATIAVARMAAALAVLSAVSLQAQYVPERVFRTAANAFSDFESMLADVATADVVFVGEQHDDPNTHRLERAMLEGLLRRRSDVVLSLEMFERDVQGPLDRFLAGQLGAADFLAASRPWPRYGTDYAPLVEFALAHGWPVLASNVPRPIANEVAKGGLPVLDAKTGDERGWFARDLQCPDDDEYFGRFAKAMGGHGQGGGSTAASDSVASSRDTLTRYYQAQCLKDETMAESIVTAGAARAVHGKAPLVVHVNGAFHSDFGLGAAARVRRRLPDARVAVITMLPVADLDTLSPGGDDLRRADYLVYTLKKQM
jgi:uncharacterized iron-regulated protein